MLRKRKLGLGQRSKPKRHEDLDDEVRLEPPSDSPGSLRGKVRLLIQTRQAQRMIGGRMPSAAASASRQGKRKRAIPGLFTFAAVVFRICDAASLDDPWADWYLLRVDADLHETRGKVQQLLNDIRSRLPKQGVEVEEAETRYPVAYPLRFRSPYAFMAAYLIADFDTLVRAVLTARHVGVMSREQGEQILNTASRELRRTLLVPTRWKDFRITRRDVLEGSETAAKARKAMGELPPEVVDGSWRADHAPAIRRPTVTDGTERHRDGEEEAG